MDSNYKTYLNSAQLDALENFEGQMLIVAGAGTGKTSTVISKILNAVETGFAKPYQILATTFTNKAANELKTRLRKYLGDEAKDVTVGTFHSISLEILQKNINYITDRESINVLPYDDQIQVVRSLLVKHGLRDLRASVMLEKIQRYKEEQGKIAGIEQILFDEYQRELERGNLMDFADLILNTIKLFHENPNIRAMYQNNLRLICVDEYQDINDLQNKWISYIHKNNHLCCVGDPDQAIYGFRGANANHILHFDRNFPGSKIVKLECNYRSTKSILDNANQLIANNRSRIPKNLYANNAESNEKVLLTRSHSSRVEAENIAEMINTLRNNYGENLPSIAILVRSRMQIPDIEEALIKNQITYKISGAIQFLDRAEIKDLMAYLKFLNNKNDTISFKRLVQAPKRGIGTVTIDKILNHAMDFQLDLLKATSEVAEASSASVKEKLSSLAKFLQEADAIKKSGLIVLANYLYINSGYIESIAPERRENVQQWIRSLADFESLHEYLEKVLWQIENEEAKNYEAEIMTIHASKGLEFDHVFLPGWEEGVLPHNFATTQQEIEEERRLAYVAITRARKQAVISHANTRMMEGKLKNYEPSRFLRELKDIQPYSIVGTKKFQVGLEVIHPRFGLGMIQESGSDLARVKFCDAVRLVELKMLRRL